MHARTSGEREDVPRPLADDAASIAAGPASAALALVTNDAPAAVLMVDLTLRTVVYANPVAMQMAPDVALPAGTEEWSDAAQLRDIAGVELSETDHPLIRVARSEPVAGQAVSAARATDLGRRREPLWVVALPMGDAPRLEGHALVVFLPMRERENAEAAATAAVTAAELREAAVLATGMSFTVVDAQAPDMPLEWVNPAFTATTGYTFEEAVGRNCRFLQGPATDPAHPAAIREALRLGQDITVTLLNHRKDGSAFWNQLSVSPIHDANGRLTHFVGVQTDVTVRVIADAERDRALAAEQAARRDAEAAHARLTLLADASSALSATRDAEEAVADLARLVVPTLGDWCVVTLVDDEEFAGTRRGLRDVGSWHADPARRPLVAAYARCRIDQMTDTSFLARALASGRPVVVQDDVVAATRSVLADGEARALITELAPSAGVVFPLRGRGRTVGLLSLYFEDARGPITAEELQTGEEVAARAGLALDSARLYRQQRDLAQGLQRSLLARPADLDHVELAVRYSPAAEAAQVGGDWYDAFPGPPTSPGAASGATVVVIGDVIGHDTQAAAAMGQLRTIVRTAAVVTGEGPAAVLSATDRALEALRLTTSATAVVARLEQDAGQRARGSATLHWSNAGHPPPALIGADGTVRFLDGGEPDLLLGVDAASPRQETSTALEPGAALLLYTDGLVERRGQSLDIGLTRLRETLAHLAGRNLSPEALLDGLETALLPGHLEDDVALLAVRLEPAG